MLKDNILHYMANTIFQEYNNELLKHGPQHIPKFIIYVGRNYYDIIMSVECCPTYMIDRKNEEFLGHPLKVVMEDGYFHVAKL